MSLNIVKQNVKVTGWDAYSNMKSSLGPADLILWLASVSPIFGNVRLQKESFLLWREYPSIVLDPGFRADKFGPYSQLIKDSIRPLKIRGFIDEMPGRTYKITKLGMEHIVNKLQSVGVTSEQITDKKIRWDEWKTQGIMMYVCRLYPQYATRTGVPHLKW